MTQCIQNANKPTIELTTDGQKSFVAVDSPFFSKQQQRIPAQILLVLHAHLPFVRHPEQPAFLEENWLFEAMLECYIPLLQMLSTLPSFYAERGALAISLSPTLLTMWQDKLLMQRFSTRLELLQQLAAEERARYRSSNNLLQLQLAEFYQQRLIAIAAFFYNECQGNLLTGWQKLAKRGIIELFTTATHALLPLQTNNRNKLAQIRLGQAEFRRVFGFAPAGLWLPECGYQPELDPILAGCGVKYTFLEAHSILTSDSAAQYGVFRPVITPTGVTIFARDQVGASYVWNATSGYPASPEYREFYRDLGHDASMSQISRYLLSDCRHDLGFKYHCITGQVDLAEKKSYSPQVAFALSRTHAQRRLQLLAEQAELIAASFDIVPTLLMPFDAELFGHWWFEGVAFLAAFLEEIIDPKWNLQLTVPGKLLPQLTTLQTLQPSYSSWGAGGYFSTWLNQKNDWIQQESLACTQKFLHFLDLFPQPDLMQQRLLDQMARELALLQSSDWPFLISADTAREYAETRVKKHRDNFNYLADCLDTKQLNPNSQIKIQTIEEQDNIFASGVANFWR